MLVIIFGLCASALLIACSLTLTRKRIFLIGLGINLFTGLQYFALGQTGTIPLIAINFLLGLVALASLKHKVLGSKPVMAAFFIAYPITFFAVGNTVSTFVDVLPLVGSAFSISAMFLKNAFHIKAAFVGTGISWLFFEASVGAYGQMIGEVLTLAGNISSMVLLSLATRKGISHEDVPELNVRLMNWVRTLRASTPSRSTVDSVQVNDRVLVNA